MTTEAQELTAEEIARRWSELLESEPRTRTRDAAAKIGVSEAQLVAVKCGAGARRLEADWGAFLARLEPLGEVMALTRNNSIVSEKIGRYRNVEMFGHVGQVLDTGIDLRVFPGRWRHAFAVAEESRGGVRRSLQFFDASGGAIHKVFLTENSDSAAYDALVAAHLSDNQSPMQPVEPPHAPEPERPDQKIDVEGFRAAWRALEDTHDFIRLLRQFGVSRTQALRLAEPGMTQPLPCDAFRRLLELAAQDGLPIMVFVGNPGCIQIHSGPVHNIKIFGDWLNVLDDGFNLHINEPSIASAWISRKPTRNGVVTGVEFYDAHGEQIATLFGKRAAGEGENERWRSILNALTPEGVPA
jgi:putative hemin transport protein